MAPVEHGRAAFAMAPLHHRSMHARAHRQVQPLYLTYHCTGCSATHRRSRFAAGRMTYGTTAYHTHMDLLAGFKPTRKAS